MPIVEFSQDDINRSVIVEPAWYRVTINGINQRPSKDAGSTNYFVEGRIICNAENGDKKFEGVPTPNNWLFNSKAMSNMVGFVAALTGEKPAPGQGYRIESAVGKEIEVFIENGLYNNQVQNQIHHKYRSAKASV